MTQAPDTEGLKRAMSEVNKRPCKCVHCDSCGGTGNVRVWYDHRGRIIENHGMDDLFELESCPQCNGAAMIDVCDRCQEMEELYEQLEEMEYRSNGTAEAQ